MLILLFIQCAMFSGKGEPKIEGDIKRARATWHNFIDAMRSGDFQKAVSYYTQDDHRWFFNQGDTGVIAGLFKMGFQKFPLIFTQLQDSIEDVVASGNRIEFTIKWHHKIAGWDTREVRYFIKRHNEFFLASPLSALTQDWITTETKYFIYHHRRGRKLHKDILRANDKLLEEILSTINLFESINTKIDFYVCNSKEEIGKITGRPLDLCNKFGIIFGVSELASHEMAHILFYRMAHHRDLEFPIPFIAEGTASCFERGAKRLTFAQKYLVENKNFRLVSIVSPDSFWGNTPEEMTRHYGIAASFVRFLIDSYGIENFKKLYKGAFYENDFHKSFLNIYGKPLEVLEPEWRDYLLKLKLPSAEAGFVPQADTIFFYNDPSGDDYGDGNYDYPLEAQYLRGIFDLTSLGIFRNNIRIGFKLKFKELPNPEQRLVAIVLVISSGGKSCLREPWSNTNLVVSKGSWDYLISIVGSLVGVSNNLGEVIEFTDLKSKIIGGDSAIAFSIPLSILPLPKRNWKFQVLVGQQAGKDRDLRFGLAQFQSILNEADSLHGGGARDNYAPNVYDIIVPKGMDQKTILGDYNATKKKYVVLPLVGRN